MENKIRQIKDLIGKANNIALFTHVNCDMDGVGSMLGLYEFLSQNGKNVEMLVDSEVPERYGFLKNFEKINQLEKDLIEKEKQEIDFKKFDLLISLDTSTLGRLGKFIKRRATERSWKRLSTSSTRI